MRIVIHHSKHYDWVPVPTDVMVTTQDIASGKVMPGATAGTWRMRVVRAVDSYTTVHLSEETLVQRIVQEKSDVRKSGRTLSRRDAVALYLQDYIINSPGAAPNPHTDWGWVTGFEVHDDGPDEERMGAHLALHTQAEHGRRVRRSCNPRHQPGRCP